MEGSSSAVYEKEVLSLYFPMVGRATMRSTYLSSEAMPLEMPMLGINSQISFAVEKLPTGRCISSRAVTKHARGGQHRSSTPRTRVLSRSSSLLAEWRRETSNWDIRGKTRHRRTSGHTLIVD